MQNMPRDSEIIPRLCLIVQMDYSGYRAVQEPLQPTPSVRVRPCVNSLANLRPPPLAPRCEQALGQALPEQPAGDQCHASQPDARVHPEG